MISLEPKNIDLRVRIATELVIDVFMQIMNVPNSHTNDLCGQSFMFGEKQNWEESKRAGAQLCQPQSCWVEFAKVFIYDWRI